MNVRGCIRGHLCLFYRMFVFLHATVALTCTFVEFAGLCDVPLAEFGPLSDRWSFAVDVITGHDRV